jgi:transcriptional regulator with XRE-family HTH domain
MTFGQRLRQIRSNAGITQKELAEKLNVTFQTISKWENDVTEPDISTIKEIAKTLGCSIEILFNDSEKEGDKKEETEKKQDEIEDSQEEKTEEPVEVVPTKVAVCDDCGKDIFDLKEVHHIQKKSAGGINEVVDICEECFTKREEEKKKKLEEINSFNKQVEAAKEKEKSKLFNQEGGKSLIWGGIIGAIALIATLVICIINFESTQLLGTILLPLLAGYVVLADIYCIFSGSFVSDVFTSIAGWSFRFPGIIFSWDLDGIMFLIAMKILFFILGILISIFVFLFALFISSALSVFAFIPLVITHTLHRK